MCQCECVRKRAGEAGLCWMLQVKMCEKGLCGQSFGRQRGGGGEARGGSGPSGQVISGPYSAGGHSCQELL